MASSMAACLRSVGVDMPHAYGKVPLLDVDSVVKALTARFQTIGDGALF